MRASHEVPDHGRAATILGLVVGLVLAGCGGDGGSPPDGAVADGPVPTIALDPGAAEVGLMTTRTFAATVTGLVDQRVSWTVAGAGCLGATCGTIDAGGRYRGPWCLPTPATVTVTATSIAQPSLAASADVTLVLGGAPFAGDYVFRFDGTTADGTLRAVGRFTIDGSGAVSAGLEDVALASGVSQAVTFTGAATQTCFRRGTITFHDSLGRSPSFAFALDGAATRGRFIELDASGGRGAGEVVRQDPSAVATGRLPDDLVVALTGRLATAAAPRVGLIGRMHADAGGGLTAGLVDVNLAGATTAAAALTGSYTASTTTGRGTATWAVAAPLARSYGLRFYVASATESFWIGTDPPSATTPLWSGRALAQTGAPFTLASVAGPMVLALAGKPPALQNTDVLLGVVTADGAGAITSGLVDENDDTAIAAAQAVTGSYTVAAGASGRGTLHLAIGAAATRDASFYLLGANRAVVLDGTAAVAGPRVGVGSLVPQVGAPFAPAALTGAFVLGTTEVATPFTPVLSGVVVVDETGLSRGLGDSSTIFANNAGVTLLAGVVAPSTLGRVAVGANVLYLVSADAARMVDVSPAQHQPVVVAIDR